MTSPLRRYVDLVNQWQLAAALAGRRAPFQRNSDTLLAAVRAFEIRYARYDEHQQAMEEYWSLRWLLQERIKTLNAVVLRENLVRVEGLPLVARLSLPPSLEPGTVVTLRLEAVDLVQRSASFTYAGQKA
jgi:exoribonuclease-2